MRARIVELMGWLTKPGGAPADILAAAALILTGGWVAWCLSGSEFYGFGWFLEQPAALGVPLVLALLVCLALSGLGVRQGLQRCATPLDRRLELAILFVVLAAAAGLRLYGLDQFPRTFDLDNAQNGYIATQLWAELTAGSYTAILDRWAPGNETLMFYLQGLSMRLLGVSVEALRLPSALVGLLTVFLIYRLGREQISARAGLAAALLCALSPWHLDLSRSAKRSVLIPLFACLVLIFLCRALRRSPSVRASVDLALCGVMLGLGLHSYELFRVVPLAVVAAIIWVRLAQRRRLWHGPAEVALVLGAAAVVALPIIFTALKSPENYFHHTAHASLLGEAMEQGALMPLLENGANALAHALDHIPLGTGWVDTRGAPIAASALALVGVFAMLSLLFAPRTTRGEGEGGPPVWIVAVGCMLGVMAGVLLLTRIHHAPRRYTGLMVPVFLLAGGAAVGILDAGVRRLGRVIVAVVALAAAVGLTTTLPQVFQHLAAYQEDYSQARSEAILRWAAAQAEEREVYISAGVLDNHYLTKFLLQKPGLRQLPGGLPLPQGPLKGDVMLVADGEKWGRVLEKLAMASWRVAEVTLPALVLGDEPVKERNLKVVVYEMSGPALARHRISLDKDEGKFDGGLVIGEAGRYQFRLPPGGRGILTLGSTSLELEGERPETVPLGSGFNPVVYTASEGTGRIQWLPPGAKTWAPLPGGLLWKLPEGTVPMAAPPEDEGWRSDEGDPVPVALTASEGDDLNTLQDMAADGDSVLVLDTNLNSLVRLKGKGWAGKRIPLMANESEPFGDWYYGGTERRSAYQQQFPTFRLAVSRGGFFLLDRLRGKVHRFTPHGGLAGKLKGPFAWPLDLSADEDAVYVADHNLGAILACDPRGESPARVLIRGIVPTSVSVLDGAMAYTDRVAHQVVVVLLDDLKVESRTTLQAVTDTTGVTLLTDDLILVTQPKRQEVHLISRRGGVLSIDGDPGLFSHPIPVFSPRAGYRASGRDGMIVLGENELADVPLTKKAVQAP